jgi:hypothetical protein
MEGLAGLVKLDLRQKANQTHEAGSGLIQNPKNTV